MMHDLLSLAIIQHHIKGLTPTQQAKASSLAESVRELVRAEPDRDVAYSVIALISAENLIDLEADPLNE